MMQLTMGRNVYPRLSDRQRQRALTRRQPTRSPPLYLLLNGHLALVARPAAAVPIFSPASTLQ